MAIENVCAPEASVMNKLDRADAADNAVNLASLINWVVSARDFISAIERQDRVGGTLGQQLRERGIMTSIEWSPEAEGNGFAALVRHQQDLISSSIG